MKKFTCVSCPKGCQLVVKENTEKNGNYIIQGNECKRGFEYALQEMKDPRRNISSTVRIENGFFNMLPVKTAKPIPKDLIFEVMQEINKTQAVAPIHTGDIIIRNVKNTGVDIIATRDIPKAIDKSKTTT